MDRGSSLYSSSFGNLLLKPKEKGASPRGYVGQGAAEATPWDHGGRRATSRLSGNNHPYLESGDEKRRRLSLSTSWGDVPTTGTTNSKARERSSPATSSTRAAYLHGAEGTVAATTLRTTASVAAPVPGRFSKTSSSSSSSSAAAAARVVVDPAVQAGLRSELKAWETTFKAEHNRRPKKADIAAVDGLADKYKQYEAMKQASKKVVPAAAAISSSFGGESSTPGSSNRSSSKQHKGVGRQHKQRTARPGSKTKAKVTGAAPPLASPIVATAASAQDGDDGSIRLGEEEHGQRRDDVACDRNGNGSYAVENEEKLLNRARTDSSSHFAASHSIRSSTASGSSSNTAVAGTGAFESAMKKKAESNGESGLQPSKKEKVVFAGSGARRRGKPPSVSSRSGHRSSSSSSSNILSAGGFGVKANAEATLSEATNGNSDSEDFEEDCAELAEYMVEALNEVKSSKGTAPAPTSAAGMLAAAMETDHLNEAGAGAGAGLTGTSEVSGKWPDDNDGAAVEKALYDPFASALLPGLGGAPRKSRKKSTGRVASGIDALTEGIFPPAQSSSTKETAKTGLRNDSKKMVSTNFVRQDLRNSRHGHRMGAKAKYSDRFKRKNHKHAQARKNNCFECGSSSHFASACPVRAANRKAAGFPSEDERGKPVDPEAIQENAHEEEESFADESAKLGIQGQVEQDLEFTKAAAEAGKVAKSEYELKRERRMAENEAMLAALGLDQSKNTKDDSSDSASSDDNDYDALKRKPQARKAKGGGKAVKRARHKSARSVEKEVKQTIQAVSAAGITDVEQLQAMRVSDLKVELKARGLPVSGKKVDLVQRLSKGTAALNGVPVIPPGVSTNPFAWTLDEDERQRLRHERKQRAHQKKQEFLLQKQETTSAAALIAPATAPTLTTTAPVSARMLEKEDPFAFVDEAPAVTKVDAEFASTAAPPLVSGDMAEPATIATLAGANAAVATDPVDSGAPEDEDADVFDGESLDHIFAMVDDASAPGGDFTRRGKAAPATDGTATADWQLGANGELQYQALGFTDDDDDDDDADADVIHEALSKKALEVQLKELTGYTEFRINQLEAIQRVLSGKSTLLVLPTGFGKSLCYQLPAYILNKHSPCLTLVVSPLISLMDDQIMQLPKGLNGASLNSTMSDTQKNKVRAKLSENKLQVLFVAPETLTSPFFVHFMQTSKLPPIHFTCIDEVHCISEWSHNFRPAYLRLCKVLRTKLGVKCILGLTATATATTEKSIIKHMQLPDAAVLRAAPVPRNLHLGVSRVPSRRDELVRFMTTHHKCSKGAAIIYCMRQADTEGLAALLRTNSVDADAYHAGMEKQERRRVQNKFMQGKLRVVVATIAFGMGLNKADVRTVIHYHLPKTAENYVQEIGRAGRDGESSYCHVFLDDDDLWFLRSHAISDGVDNINVKRLLRLVLQVPPECIEVEAACRVAALRVGKGAKQLVAAAEKKPRVVTLPIEKVQLLLDMKETVMATILTDLELRGNGLIEQLPVVDATISIKLWSSDIYREDPLLAAVVSAGRKAAKAGFMDVDTATVANALGIAPADVLRALRDFKKAGKLAFQSSDKSFCVQVNRFTSSEEFEKIFIDSCKAAHNLERGQLAKIEFIHHTLSDAIAKRDAAADAEAPAKLMSSLIHTDLKQYFSLEGGVRSTIDGDAATLRAEVEAAVQRDVRSLLIEQRTRETAMGSARAVARIFHGIGSPVYPTRIWSTHAMWRRHDRIEFDALIKVAIKEMRKFMTGL